MNSSAPQGREDVPATRTLRETAEAIVGLGERLLASGLAPGQAGLARSIVDEAAHLAAALATLAEADRPAPLHAGAIVERALAGVMPAAAAKGVEFRFEAPGGLPGITVADPAAVTGALQGLLSYALERCDAGPLAVTVSIDGPAPEAPGHRLVVSVTDEGPAGHAPREGPADQPDWTGEALSAAGARVELHGTGDSGTGLRLVVPCRVAPADAGEGLSATDFTGACLLRAGRPGDLPVAATRSAAHEKPLSILLADDYAVNRMLQQAQLERLGYRVDTVANGEEVLRALTARAYDVVLLDLDMPVMGGLEAARRVRATPERPRPFIVAVTASPLGEVREDLLAAGMDAYLPKPVDARKLAALLGHAFDSAAGNRPAAPPAGAAGHEPVLLSLDPLYERLGEAADGLLRRVIPVFLRELPGRVRGLRAAFDGADVENFGRLCHGLKGSSRSLGATDLALACERLETRAYDGALPPPGDLDAVLALAGRTSEELSRKLAELGG